MEQLTVKGDVFKNESGREVLLQGINYVCKEKELNYLWPEHRKNFAWFAQNGFNLIRLGIFWDGVEPHPGIYDDLYMERVEDVISDAEKENLYVMVDMHQDLWSVLYADGAPAWATLTDGAMHPSDCAMWFDAYLKSDAIINAADHFWQNDPAEDGIGLMDHYFAMWEYVVRKLNKHKNIIGYEPMNEPFMGSLARETFALAGMKTKEKYPEFDFPTMQGVTPESQAYMGEIVSSAFMDFDKKILMPFYQKMNERIRSYSDKALITGGNIYCSANFHSGIERVKGKDGKPETQQIYAPHGYDSVVDSDSYDRYNAKNVEALFADKYMTQAELQLPVIVGEWGAFPSKDFSNQLIDQMNGILEKYLWSSTYWQYLPGMETDNYYSALKRGYPSETEGTLKSYHYDRNKQQLQVTWIGQKVICFIPFTQYQIHGCAVDYAEVYKMQEDSVYLIIKTENDGEKTIIIDQLA
ncbi:hypothetical protein IMSAG249_00323 [Lachnospiraceae bacterium]|jgi:Endoglucanase|nr:hypothetical protein IMSAGC009_00909 [Lachnospiraceae bacterium]GFI68506.1 hypothetical protein IMSAG249_00323 [Lachnospiraceae bacterium]